MPNLTPREWMQRGDDEMIIEMIHQSNDGKKENVFVSGKRKKQRLKTHQSHSFALAKEASNVLIIDASL